MLEQTASAGLYEIARIAKIPVQRAVRCTIGTSLTSMQMAWAWANGVLIPMEKQQVEDFRPATDLLIADKGGLAARRRDTPQLFKKMQQELLQTLARAPHGGDLRAQVPALLEIVEEYRLRVREGRVSADEFAIAFHLSKAPEAYVHDTVSSLAAKQLAAAGVALHPGETVRYIITNADDEVKDWRSKPLALMENGLEYDVGKYLQLLERAAWEILEGLAPAPELKIKRRKCPSAVLDLPLLWNR